MVREEERDRIARELHDGVLGRLNTLRLQEEATKSPNLRGIAAVEEEVRRIVDQEQLLVLRSAGLEPAIEDVLSSVRVSGVLAVARLDLIDGRPPWEVEVAAFRTIQQAITNSIAHASATSVIVTGTIGADRVAVSVVDDGPGLGAPRSRTTHPSIGMLAMKERAIEVGARLRVRSGSRGVEVSFDWQP